MFNTQLSIFPKISNCGEYDSRSGSMATRSFSTSWDVIQQRPKQQRMLNADLLEIDFFFDLSKIGC